MNDMVKSIKGTIMQKPMKYDVAVFTNLIKTKKEIYLSKRDYYAEEEDSINMRYYGAKADACNELLYTINEMF